MEKQRKPFTRALIVLAITAVLLICAITAVYFEYYNTTPPSDNLVYEWQDKRIEYLPGVRIDGVAVDSMTVEEARERVLATQIKPLGQVKVVSGERETLLDLSSLVPTRNVEKALADGIALSDTATEQRELNEQRLRQEGGQDFYSELSYDLSPLRGAVEKAALDLSLDPVDAKIEILTEEQRAAKQLTQTADSEEERNDNQSINIDDLVNFVDAVPGSKVDANELFTVVQQAIDDGSWEEGLQIDGTEVKPEKNLDEIKKNFTLISETSSSFAGGSYGVPNRVFNLQKASAILNGYVIEPDENFSCNTAFGPRSASTGWKAAGAISNGKSVQEVGGGICQVSSTLFNSVLKADLEIVDRNPHSWPLSYLPAGQDATISTGGPDFVFKNNRETPVVMVANVDTNKKELVIQIFGEPIADGLRIELRSEKTGTIPQPGGTTTSNPDAVRSGRSGSSYKTYKQYYKDDTMVREEFAYDTRYRAFGSISLAGGGGGSKKQAPAPAMQEEGASNNNDAPAPAPAPAVEESSSNDIVEIDDVDIPIELE